MNKKILLIDANALIHRAFHALPPLTTREGKIINAAYGFSMILLKAIKDINPLYIAIAFDHPKPTFRHEKFKAYKATRQKAPDELVEQFPRVKEIVNALSFPIFEKEGYEADDIVGTLAKQANAKGIEAIIVTGDSDEIQLVNKLTKVYTMKRGFTDTVLYNIAKVKEKYEGLAPNNLIDLKTLKGDSSDNIPGIPGVGDKTALSLIKEFGNIENLYKSIAEKSKKTDLIKPKVYKALCDNKNQAKISKALITIIKNVPVKLNLNKSEIQNYNKEAAIEIFKKYGFKTLLTKLPESNNKTLTKNKDFEYKIINDEKSLKTISDIFLKEKFLVVDTETEKLDAISGKLIGISFSTEQKKGYYIPIKSDNPLLLKKLKKLLENSKIKKIGHNLKYDINVLASYGIKLSPIYFDTMIASYLLHPGERRFNLDDLAFSELGYEKISIEDLIGEKGKNQKSMSEVDLEKIAQYSVEDAVITKRLYDKLKNRINKGKVFELFEEIEMPIIEVLAEMEKNGIKIDKVFLEKTAKKLSDKILKLKKRINTLTKYDFNINSPSQLKEILFEKLKLAENPEVRKNMRRLKSGGYSTDASSLSKLRNTHPVVALILENRELTKLKTTYADTLPKLINKKTKRLHTNFNQTITATGRLSSSDPNLQNIPIRTKVGREIRKAFIAKKGFKLISADYSQIELRIIAHLSKDKTMVASFTNHEDIHARTAAEVNEVPLSKVTYEMRNAAKATNFGIVYGIGPHGLAEQLGWSFTKAKKYIQKYYEKHIDLIDFLKETISETRERGYAETLFGRRRYIPEIISSNFQVRASGERMAINFPAQGTAADFIKKAMIEIYKKLPAISKGSKLLLQVHDELVLEVPEKDLKKVSFFLEKTMEGVFPSLAVPIQVDISYGNNWKDLKKIIKGDKRKTKGFSH